MKTDGLPKECCCAHKSSLRTSLPCVATLASTLERKTIQKDASKERRRQQGETRTSRCLGVYDIYSSGVHLRQQIDHVYQCLSYRPRNEMHILPRCFTGLVAPLASLWTASIDSVIRGICPPCSFCPHFCPHTHLFRRGFPGSHMTKRGRKPILTDSPPRFSWSG